jgi:hypothetical protein
VPIPFDDCATLVCEYTDELKSGPSRINFWYFLFWYFGIYNGIALFLIVKLFSIYALNVRTFERGLYNDTETKFYFLYFVR